MNYTEAVEYIHSLRQNKKTAGFKNLSLLLELLGNPHRALKFIHVAGTNGKGSTCAMISTVLHTAGYKTGLFISPFILEFGERIQIDGKTMPHSHTAEVTSHIREVIENNLRPDMYPSEFEFLTAAALFYYRRENCEIVVLETGIGGRLDSTNIIPAPLASAICTIGYDHTEILGNTIEEIAREKCGIIKSGSFVTGYAKLPDKAREILVRTCEAHGCPLVIPDSGAVEMKSVGALESTVVYKGLKLYIPLGGEHQIYNCLTATETLFALRKCGFPLTDEQIAEGISRVRFPVRMEKVGEHPLTIIDGAHNPDGISALVRAVKLSDKHPVVAVVGMMKDKDTESSLELIAKNFDSVITVTADYPGRAATADELVRVSLKYNPDSRACGSFSEAWETAKNLAAEDGLIIVCGSLYFASDMRGLLLG